MSHWTILRTAEKVRQAIRWLPEDRWHSWFAWYPILTLTDHTVWLRWVEHATVRVEHEGDMVSVTVYRLA